MKAFIGEIFDPIRDFYSIRNRTEKFILSLLPIIVGIVSYILTLNISLIKEVNRYSFVNDIVGQFITILTLFISFSMGYLTLVITSNSKNVEDMKTSYSKTRFKDKKREEPYSVYEMLISEITYTLLIEIALLFLCIVEKFLIGSWGSSVWKIILCIDMACFVHVLIMLLVIVKNIYYSFWKPI